MKKTIVVMTMGLMLVAPVAIAQGEAKEIKAKVVKRDVAAASKTETSSMANSAKTVCSNGDLQRHLEVEYDDPTTKAPCRVHYRKTSEDPQHHQVLWTANSDGAFCETKADEFRTKLEGWGWSCQ